MKQIYYILAISFALMGLILALQNIGSTSSIWIFMSNKTGSLFIPFILLLVLGAASGLFLGLAYSAKKKRDIENESLDI